jgi:hypothetical protein
MRDASAHACERCPSGIGDNSRQVTAGLVLELVRQRAALELRPARSPLYGTGGRNGGARVSRAGSSGPQLASAFSVSFRGAIGEARSARSTGATPTRGYITDRRLAGKQNAASGKHLHHRGDVAGEVSERGAWRRSIARKWRFLCRGRRVVAPKPGTANITGNVGLGGAPWPQKRSKLRMCFELRAIAFVAGEFTPPNSVADR